jgi:hypothetical protein
MKIIKIEDIEYVELENFSKPIFIERTELEQADIDKFEILDKVDDTDTSIN